MTWSYDLALGLRATTDMISSTCLVRLGRALLWLPGRRACLQNWSTHHRMQQALCQRIVPCLELRAAIDMTNATCLVHSRL